MVVIYDFCCFQVTYLGGNRDGGDITFAPDVWTKLGEEVSPCFRGAPPLSPLCVYIFISI
jgi:hypothetical protein